MATGSNKTSWIIGIAVGLVSVILVTVVVILFVAYTVAGNDEISGPSTEGFTYRYTTLSSEGNKKSSGIVTTPQQIEDVQTSTMDSLGNHILISKFGTSEFQYTGSCYCDSDRRTAGTAARSGLTVLISAFTASVALRVAQEHFQEECENLLSDECQQADIRSHVMEAKDCTCDKQLESCECDPGGGIQIGESVPNKMKPPVPRKYLCKGKCLDRDVSFDYQELVESGKGPQINIEIHRENMGALQEAVQGFDCEKLDMSEVITVEVPFEFTLDSDQEDMIVREEFQRLNLGPYCTASSYANVDYVIKGRSRPLKKSLCVGKTRENNPTVVCVKAD